MSDLSTATAAPFTREFQGRKYKFSPLRLRQWGELEQWLRTKMVQFTMDGCSNLLEKDRLAVLRDAMKIAAQVSLSHMSQPDLAPVHNRLSEILDAAYSGAPRAEAESMCESLIELCTQAASAESSEARAVRSLMSSPDGMLQIIMLSLKREHPTITMPTVERIVDAAGDQMAELVEQIMTLSLPSTSRSADPKVEEEKVDQTP